MICRFGDVSCVVAGELEMGSWAEWKAWSVGLVELGIEDWGD